MVHAEEDTAVTDVTRPVVVAEHQHFLLVLHSRDKSRVRTRYELTEPVHRIGRVAGNDIVVSDEGVSRDHARIERTSQGFRLMDVGSRNGTLLNGAPLDGTAFLKSGDQIKLGSEILKFLGGADVETAFYEEIYRLAITDHLTGLGNRKKFDDALATEFARAKRHSRPLSVIAMDIDHFKRVNDTYGHAGGDVALSELGRVIAARVRATDVAARTGGEEFGVVMPETCLAGAKALAEELRRGATEIEIVVGDQRFGITISVGCVELAEKDVDFAALYRRADDNLYAAKHQGRDRVVG